MYGKVPRFHFSSKYAGIKKRQCLPNGEDGEGNNQKDDSGSRRWHPIGSRASVILFASVLLTPFSHYTERKQATFVLLLAAIRIDIENSHLVASVL